MEDVIRVITEGWERQLNAVLPDRPDLIVLPECCDQPSKPGQTTEWLYEFYRYRGTRIADFFAAVAKANRCYIAYSAMVEASDGTFRNATWLIDRSGDICGVYHKNFLTIQQKSTSSTLYGKEATVIETDFGRVACAICFDLNFTELLDQYVQQKPDLILFPSAYHGGLMQGYWAYTCRAYFAAAVWAPNPSSIVSPLGETIAQTTTNYSYVTETVNLDCAVVHQDYNIPRLQAMKQKYGPKVRIHDPGRLGAILIASETDECTIAQMIEEFDVETLDAYFVRSRADRCKGGHMES
jgi:predicted amidohydrolase